MYLITEKFKFKSFKGDITVEFEPNGTSEQSFNNTQETKKSPVKEFSFTTEQIERLEAFFQRKKFINIFEIEKLATTGSYPEERVQQWFEKRRKEIGKLSNDTQKNL